MLHNEAGLGVGCGSARILFGSLCSVASGWRGLIGVTHTLHLRVLWWSHTPPWYHHHSSLEKFEGQPCTRPPLKVSGELEDVLGEVT